MKAHEALIVIHHVRVPVILNELFAFREKDHNRLNKYSIPFKLSLQNSIQPSIYVADVAALSQFKFNHTPTKHYPLY